MPLDELAGVWGGVGGSAMRSISVGPEAGSDGKIGFPPRPSGDIEAQSESFHRMVFKREDELAIVADIDID